MCARRLPSDRRIAVVLAHGATVLIVGQAAVFYGLVLRARLALGRWPEPHRPDPKDLDFGVHSTIAVLGVIGAGVSPILAVMLLAAARARGLSRRHAYAAALTFGACYLMGILLVRADPGRFGEWLLD
jgi:hypothetical protein